MPDFPIGTRDPSRFGLVVDLFLCAVPAVGTVMLLVLIPPIRLFQRLEAR